jgi:hypothetical protein
MDKTSGVNEASDKGGSGLGLNADLRGFRPRP